MKILFMLATAIGVLVLVAEPVLAQTGRDLFQQALIQERTERDIAEAIKLYQTIVDRHAADRPLVARALLQMGMCYEKIGKTEDARKAFDRIVREYKDQTTRTVAITHLEGLNRKRSIVQVGAIRGHVFQQDKLIGATVVALKTVYSDGLRRMVPVLSAKTSDETGEYVLSPLPPGKYYVAAGAWSSSGLVPAFFPNTPDQRRAELVEVRPGSTSNLDIVATPEPLRRLRGTVTGIGPFRGAEDPIRGSPLRVSLVPTHKLPAAIMRGFPSAQVTNGSFEFPGVPPGTYVLNVFQNYANAGQTAVDVTDRDVDGIVIAMIPGLTVSGRIVMDPPTTAVPAPGNGGLFYRVTLRRDPPLDPVGFQILGATMSDYGTFTFPGGSIALQRGDYRVNISPLLTTPASPEDTFLGIGIEKAPPKVPMSFYVKSIRLGDADVLNDGLHLQERPREELVIVLGANTKTLEGRVLNARQQPIREATVVLIPEGGIRFRVDHRFTTTDGSGRFRLERVPPGDYKVFAWEEVENYAWQDPDFVRPYENKGKLIRIKESDRLANVEVIGIPARR